MTLAPYYLTPTPKNNRNMFGYYVQNLERDRFTYQHFATMYAAKHFILMMIDGDEFKWDVWQPNQSAIAQPMIRTERGLTIHGHRLEDVMEHEFTAEEAAFVFPEPMLSSFTRFPRLGKEAPPAPDTSIEVVDAETGEVTKVKPPRAPKPEKPARPSKEGLITVQAIAEAMKIDPKHARAALRKAEVAKPEAGWAFPPKEAKAIAKTIADNLKPGTSFTAYKG